MTRALRWASVATMVTIASCATSPGPTAHDHAAMKGEPSVAAPMGSMGATHDHEGHGPAAAPSGYAMVTIDPERMGTLGLTTMKAEHHMFEKTVRTVGVLTLDETRTAHVHAKVRGYIEGIQTDFVGKSVKQGTPLCAIFSQGVYAAELEYVALLKQRPAPSANAIFADAEKKSWDALLDAARRRLLLWDVPKAEISRLDQTMEPNRTFSLFAPRAGVVVAKQAFVGNFVEPGTELYVISDLSKLWAIVDVYEVDLPYVHLGDEVALTIEGLEQPLTAKVAFLAPTIDESTRTLKVRIELSNADGKLRPGAFVSATLKANLGHGLAIPESAVVHTGARDIVFVIHGPHVMPREVKLGPLMGGFYRVVSGVEDGELVATGAQFLLDSESRLAATNEAGGGGSHAGHAGH